MKMYHWESAPFDGDGWYWVQYLNDPLVIVHVANKQAHYTNGEAYRVIDLPGAKWCKVSEPTCKCLEEEAS